jgi:hypothetical protein
VSNSLSEIVKSEMMKLTGRENTYVSDADVVVSWMLYIDVDCCWSIGGREGEKKWSDTIERERVWATIETSLMIHVPATTLERMGTSYYLGFTNRDASVHLFFSYKLATPNVQLETLEYRVVCRFRYEAFRFCRDYL